MLTHENNAQAKGFRRIAGVDEAGRGPLAGPVVAAAVVLGETAALAGLRDSKKLTPEARERFYPIIRATAAAHAVAVIPVEVIDRVNILQASLLAMKQAVEQLAPLPDCLLIDGNKGLALALAQQTIVGGDDLSLSIAAASVLAKVTRDRLMLEYHASFPRYGFDQHKGYGTLLHRERIKQYGPCVIHRRTFKGVREFL